MVQLRRRHGDFGQQLEAVWGVGNRFRPEASTLLQPLLLPGQRAAFAEPLIKVDATHALVVVGIYAAVFLLLSIVLTARRDVLQ